MLSNPFTVIDVANHLADGLKPEQIAQVKSWEDAEVLAAATVGYFDDLWEELAEAIYCRAEITRPGPTEPLL